MSGLTHNSDQEPQIPASLADALRMARVDGPAVPAAVNEVMLAAAREQAGRVRNIRGRRVIIGRIAAVAGLAAAVALAAVIWPRSGGGTRTTIVADGRHEPSSKATGTDPRDVNGDGVVDILDAFTIAKAVELTPEERKVRAAGKNWDFNGDGVVDRRDADAIAVSVVRLSPPAGRG